MKISQFLTQHFRHFNAASIVDAAVGYSRHIDNGGSMIVTLAGAMSTAELGISLAEMIRQEKIHAISCTGANLEEDVFNLVAHDKYVRIPEWRHLTPADEKRLESQGLNRVTDTCIPEEEAFRAVEQPLLEMWTATDKNGERRFPHEFLYDLLNQGLLTDTYCIDPQDSWLAAAAEKNLPLFVPGWEDSTLANIFAARVIDGTLSRWDIIRSGPEYMGSLVDWYARETLGRSISDLESTASDDAPVAPPGPHTETGQRAVGFFQIGGGIAGDFPICAVPLIRQDLGVACPYWAYFCQISDSTTSYGSYSGAFPTEKITWGKLDVDTPMYLIESDATIVAPLVFAHVLGW
ncbi:MAG: deoxyhypusine synthase family protein [Acidobacteriota bacterium]|nr:deoxyhypusine synthase family protein [Acidobacteriota bacterium]